MACALFAQMLAAAIAGEDPPEHFGDNGSGMDGRLALAIARGSWRGKPRSAIRSSGYVIDSFEAALWSVARTTCFADAVLTAANLGGDADTTAASPGSLPGPAMDSAGSRKPGSTGWRGGSGLSASRGSCSIPGPKGCCSPPPYHARCLRRAGYDLSRQPK